MTRQEVHDEAEDEATCVCPFCDSVLEMPAPWCQVCEVEITYCGSCEQPLPQDATVCPNCGAECRG
jgi:hypothetical protein